MNQASGDPSADLSVIWSSSSTLSLNLKSPEKIFNTPKVQHLYEENQKVNPHYIKANLQKKYEHNLWNHYNIYNKFFINPN